MTYLLKGFAGVLSALAFTFFVSGTSVAGSYANADLLMETADLSNMLGREDVRIVDVRPRKSYSKGHIPGAVNLSADDVIDPHAPVNGHLLPNQQLATRLGALGIDRQTKVVLYDDKGGFHAARLFWMLEYFGHRKVAVLNGGYPKWMKEGRLISERSREPQPKTFVINLTPRRHASADWILDRRGERSNVVIDVRPTKLFKAGHIPWAQNIPWSQNLKADATMKSEKELLAHFAARGVTEDKNIVVHCQNGKAAAHSYFTLRLLGFPRVRSYDRSWMEWSAADDLPKQKG